MPSLECVILDCTSITDEGMKELAQIPTLRYISLNGPTITDVGIRHLCFHPNVEEVYLGELATSEKSFESLATLPRLRTLDVWGDSVTDEALSALGACDELSVVALRKTTVTDQGLVHLAELRNLRSLELNGACVTGKAFQSGFADLEELVIHGSLVDDDGLESIVQLPAINYFDMEKMCITEFGVIRAMETKQFVASVQGPESSFPNRAVEYVFFSWSNAIGHHIRERW